MIKFSGLLLSASFLSVSLSCTTLKKTTPSVEIKSETGVALKADDLLTTLFSKYQGYFDSLLKHNDKWRIQIIYTQIDRLRGNKPVLTHHYFNADPQEYFYPASTVKMPAAVLALQKMNELNIAGLDKATTMITEAAAPDQTAVYNDPSSEDGRPTIAHYIKKIFLVSDNDAYNRLYEFLGQEYLNNSLHKMGYDSVQLIHRLSLPLNEEQNRTTNPVAFYDSVGKIIYRQPLVNSKLVYQPRHTFLGNAFMRGDSLVKQPFNFSDKNRVSLADLHSILQSIVLPETVSAKQRFTLTEDDYQFLYRYMSMKPKESRFPQYDTTHFTDAYVKFHLYGGGGPMNNPAIRIFNKVGEAYGFLQDVAYVVDFEKGVEFMLSANIFCASNGIINYEGNYEYDTVGFPFFKHLGEVIYQYETERRKKNLPDLSKFKLAY